MGKTLKDIPTRSASAETQPLGVAMSIEDLDIDVRTRSVAESLGRVMPLPAPAPASTSPQVATPAPVANPQKKKPASQMLSTPIPAALKKRLNGLRLQNSISTAFVVEVALNDFFGDRDDDAVAADLLARGGRLRRNNG